ncbi:hypothetical protein ACTFIU_000711 [Dictyostelium citrinum]
MDETYEENEKVLVHHQNRIYEAKIIKVDPKTSKSDKKKPLYFIHYLGWKEKWNEWIEPNKILKFTDKNRELQKKTNIKASLSSSTNKKNTKKAKEVVKQPIVYDSENSDEDENESEEDGGGGEDIEDGGEDTEDQENSNDTGGEDADDNNPSPRSTGSSSSSSSSSKSNNNKRKRNDSKSYSSHTQSTKFIDIEIPLSLKNKLVDDWNSINNEKSILSLPRSPNVKDILNKIVEENDKSSECKEIVNGIKQYFNKALGTLLLYKFERPQYDSILKNNPKKSMSEIYGAEHLLRLFVKLPHLLVISNLEEKTVTQLKDAFEIVLEYLEKNASTLFLKEYTVASSPYLKAASSN